MADPAGVCSTCPIVREIALGTVKAQELGIRGPRNVLLYLEERLRTKGERIGDELGRRFTDAAEACLHVSNM
jgi:hypothetical protein